MQSIDKLNPTVVSIRERINNTFEKDQHGDRALYLASWLSTQIPPTNRQAASIRTVAYEILSDIWAEVSMMLKGSEKAPPEVETLRQIHEIGRYRIMGGDKRVGTVIANAVTNKLNGRPFAYTYLCTLLPPEKSFREKVKELSDWFYSEDQDAHNYLYYAHKDLPKENENMPRLLTKSAPKGNLRIRVLIDTTNTRLKRK